MGQVPIGLSMNAQQYSFLFPINHGVNTSFTYVQPYINASYITPLFGPQATSHRL